MVFKDNFIVVIKANGNILRELDGYVTLPFGIDYAILLKNKESRKAVVSIEIDGQDVLDGDKLILDPNSKVELEGFKKGNKVTNRFRFIQKTQEIADYRGDRIDDGYIRIEVNFEERVTTEIVKYWYNPWLWNGWGISHGSAVFDSSPTDKNSFQVSSCETQLSYETKTRNFPEPNEDEGITVKGSDDVNQGFIKGYTKPLEKESTVIILKLRGINSKGSSINEPITVKTKLECPTCGRMTHSNFKFCANCGTALQ